ncbi:MAG: mechanosensitive ion channel family protein [Chitinophagaceae bacterium]|jgi:MscS family membrane protein|nr:mechanosensitive ion channel family protein [Chitinophagaceae bacterium]
MNNFLEQVYLNNSVKNYLVVAGIILMAIIFKRYVSKYIAGLLYVLVAKASKNIQKKLFCDLVVQPLDSFLVLFISFVAIDKLNFPEALDFKVFKVTSKSIIESIIYGTLIAVFIWLCLRLIDFIAMVLEEKANDTDDLTDNQLIVFFKDFFKVILVIIGVLLILRFSFNRNIGNLLTGLSIVGAALALATRESLENLIASFIIFFDKPFVTGDLVKVHNFTGTVEKIGLRSTRIRTDSKTYITVPNKQMVDSILDNISLRTQRKVEIRIEIGLDADAEKLQQLTPAIKQILSGFSAIENSSVFFMETGKHAHVFAIDYFTQMPQDFDAFNSDREQINLAILRLLQSMQLELAATSTDVKMHNA